MARKRKAVVKRKSKAPAGAVTTASEIEKPGDVDLPRLENHVVGPTTVQRLVRANECGELETVGVSMAGVSDAAAVQSEKSEFQFTRVWPSFSQVLLTVEGAGEVLVGERWMVLEKGQAYLTPARVRHAYRTISGKRWSVAWVHYREYATMFSVPRVAPVNDALLVTAIDGLLREVEGAELPAAKLCWARLIDIAARRVLGPDARDERTSGVWATVAADLARPWSLTELAELSGVSIEQFRRVCQTTLGRPPMHHLIQLRMQRAADLLASTDLKSEEIAHRVGYDSMFAFSAAFKREMGVSPVGYRK